MDHPAFDLELYRHYGEMYSIWNIIWTKGTITILLDSGIRLDREISDFIINCSNCNRACNNERLCILGPRQFSNEKIDISLRRTADSCSLEQQRKQVRNNLMKKGYSIFFI